MQKLRLACKQQASVISSITTLSNNETGDQSSVTHAGDQFAKAKKKKKGRIDNLFKTATLLIQVAATLKTRSLRTETIKISAVCSVHIHEERSELDSHADTCVAGAAWKVMEYTGVVCNVYPYSDSYKPLKQVPVVEAVTAYNHPTGETFILLLALGLYLGD